MGEEQTVTGTKSVTRSITRTLAAILIVAFASGCEVNSWLGDPSKTGYFEFTPTMIPVLERLDVIERHTDLWGETTGVLPEDLMPGELSYRISPGDLITVGIFELYVQGQWTTSSRQVSASGEFRIPELGEVQAAGLTAQEFEDRIIKLLEESVFDNPLVDVVVEQGGGLTYTVYGYVGATGLYTLRSPDLRLLDALAIAGGISPTTVNIFVIREVPLTEEVVPSFERNKPAPTSNQPDTGEQKPINIEELIENLEPNPGAISPGAMAQDEKIPPPPSGADDETFIFVEELGQWVRTRSPGTETPSSLMPDSSKDVKPHHLITQRIIKIPYQKLSHGDSSLNIVIRPDDRIFVDGPKQGVVYIDGEVVRPGVYSLPIQGKLTLSRLCAAAGGFSAIAVPSRADLTRVVGPGREATVRVDISAIRERHEPDLVLKPDDHIIVGTNFWATPMAVIRNGFRATYGFGFLLDRNFGNDVFGPPPRSGVFE
jgi:polysaccharide export outer membrane protein